MPSNDQFTTIAVVGQPRSGKSSLILKITGDKSDKDKQNPRLLPPKHFELDASFGQSVHLLFLEINEENQQETDFILGESNIVLVVVDINSQYQKDEVNKWIERSRKHKKPIFVIQSKADLLEGEVEDLTTLVERYEKYQYCGTTSVKKKRGVEEIVGALCQFALFPTDVIFDATSKNLNKSSVPAFERVFWILDRDGDGELSQTEFTELLSIFQSSDPEINIEKPSGCNLISYLSIIKDLMQLNRFDLVWTLLREFSYQDNLQVDDVGISQLYLPEHNPATDIIVLTNYGRDVLTALFKRIDTDSDLLLSQQELTSAFMFVPLKDSLITVADQFTNGHDMCQSVHKKMTLVGWLALWSFTTRQDPQALLRCLVFWGIPESILSRTLQIKKKRDFRNGPQDMPDTIQCYVFGAAKSGKTCLMKSLIGQEFDHEYSATNEQHSVVNVVDYRDQRYYLVVTEFQDIEVPVILKRLENMNQCDVVCLVYDASDQFSFLHLSTVQKDLSKTLPRLFVSSKVDLQEVDQDFDVTPEEYCDRLQLVRPLRVSVAGADDALHISELWKELVLAAVNPDLALPEWEESEDSDEEEEEIVPREVPNVVVKRVVRIGLAVGVLAAVGYAVYRFGFKKAESKQ
ncbi:mitochondrial Rho GTPase [Acrasis kona]|uniref:Mitochondrial Rho GTPase n=1 Tax=Acrasis kona TaxID=1008807 RepID=A0AAW2YVG1_9EUKA